MPMSGREPGEQPSDSAQQYAVEACGLSMRFGGFTAVDGVSFAVERGSIFGFLGPNGAGKTTTIRILLGLLKPTSGKASVLGFDVAERAGQIKKRMGYVSQRFSLYDDLTVDENLSFYGRTYGVRGARLRERKESVLQMAGLEGRQRVLTRHLAGGWKQRLALGAAILHEPEILFLDEPTAGVDPISRRGFWDLLYDLAARGTTILVTTHYMDEAEHCQHLAFIQRGRIVAQGAPAALKESAMRGQVLEIDSTSPGRAIVVLRQMGLFEEVAMYGALIHAIAPNAAAVLSQVAERLHDAQVGVRGIVVITPSLEDVFISSVRTPTGLPRVGEGGPG
jgi:ABC-2 type transport system ATP-binding protein